MVEPRKCENSSTFYPCTTDDVLDDLLERQLRDKTRLDLSIVRTKIDNRYLKDWNLLPKCKREITSIHCFKQTLF